jgi:hypothetical protein
VNFRDLRNFLALQIVAIAVAGLSFGLIGNRLLAASVAGGYFVLSGLYMVYTAYAWKDKWRTFMWYPLLAHVFAVSIPMVSTRFLQASLAFHEIKIWGLAGPQFHRLSTFVFSVLILATLFDLLRSMRANR